MKSTQELFDELLECIARAGEIADELARRFGHDRGTAPLADDPNAID